MTNPVSRGNPYSQSGVRMTQPPEMKTKNYVCGIEKLNGLDAWALFEACGGQADPSGSERLRQMVAFLLKRGAATNLPGDQPWATPLAWATRHKLSDLVELLTLLGAT